MEVVEGSSRRGVCVEVLGVPSFMPPDRTVDKLLIHFLRPRNGGGEVRRVLYPTQVPGQALVLYEEPDVATRVLKKPFHELEVGNQRYPLQVKPVDRPELDLPVEATLNVSSIADETSLKQLLFRHGFGVVKWDHSMQRVRVKGTMMTLRLLQADIERLPRQQTPPAASVARPPTFSASSPSPSSSSSPSPRQGPWPAKNSIQGRSAAHAKQKPMRSTDPPTYSSLPTTPTTPTTSTSPSSFSHSPPSPVGPAAVNGRPPSTRKTRPVQEALLVSSDVMDYAQRYKQGDITRILERSQHRHDGGIEMNVVAMENDLSSVVVTGRNAVDVAAQLRALLDELNTSLRVRRVEPDRPDGGGVQAARARELAAQSYPAVLVKQTDGAVLLIGPRVPCDRLKDRLLLEMPTAAAAAAEAEPARAGRSQERQLSGRRSRSAPRTSTRRGGGGEELAAAVDATANGAPLSLDAGGRFIPLRIRGGGEGGGAQGTASALTPEVRGQRGGRPGAQPEEGKADSGGREKTNFKFTPAMKEALLPQALRKKLNWKF